MGRTVETTEHMSRARHLRHVQKRRLTDTAFFIKCSPQDLEAFELRQKRLSDTTLFLLRGLLNINCAPDRLWDAVSPTGIVIGHWTANAGLQMLDLSPPADLDLDDSRFDDAESDPLPHGAEG